jgi:hypothetical protein
MTNIDLIELAEAALILGFALILIALAAVILILGSVGAINKFREQTKKFDEQREASCGLTKEEVYSICVEVVADCFAVLKKKNDGGDSK